MDNMNFSNENTVCPKAVGKENLAFILNQNAEKIAQALESVSRIKAHFFGRESEDKCQAIMSAPECMKEDILAQRNQLSTLLRILGEIEEGM